MIKKIWRHRNLDESFIGALKGIYVVLKTERNAKVILLLGILSIVLATYLKLPLNELALLIFVVISVFVAEVFNTLVENICNIIRPEDDPHIKILKDIASAAVLIMSAGAAIVGGIILIPKILQL